MGLANSAMYVEWRDGRPHLERECLGDAPQPHAHVLESKHMNGAAWNRRQRSHPSSRGYLLLLLLPRTWLTRHRAWSSADQSGFPRLWPIHALAPPGSDASSENMALSRAMRPLCLGARARAAVVVVVVVEVSGGGDAGGRVGVTCLVWSITLSAGYESQIGNTVPRVPRRAPARAHTHSPASQ
jgi:hypothetical protein